MEDVTSKLRRVLSARFPGSFAELDPPGVGEKVGGFLIWNGFEPLEQLDRQIMLDQAINEELTPDERRGVTTILTVTPDEISVMREG